MLMFRKWDSKLLLLSRVKYEGYMKIFKYYFFRKNNIKQNEVKKGLEDKKTYFKSNTFQLAGEPTFLKVENKYLKTDKDKILKFSEKIMNHKFNLLGSGWVDLGYENNNYAGYNGKIYNLNHTKKPSEDTTGEYKPIKWNVDFVSGYEWSGDKYFKDIKFGGDYGADIKKPWELGRFYHLAQLAFAYNLSSKPKYLIEIKNQFYDFTQCCPVYMGPQWGNAMEVGIRAINWIFCIDQVGIENFEDSFVADYSNFLLEHLDYILAELEWTVIARSNHYLANLSAIIVILSRVEKTEELKSLYYWAACELNHEINFQFGEDGGNYEGSTGYHRLSSELVFIAINILKGQKPIRNSSYKKFKSKNKFKLPQFHNKKFSMNEHEELISKIFSFMENINIESGKMIQVGDMDSGRVLKLTLLFDDELENENQLDVSPVQALVSSKFENHIESKVFKSKFNLTYKASNYKAEDVEIDYFLKTKLNLHRNNQNYIWESDVDLLESLKFSSFDEFGLYIIESKNLFLSVRCGGNGQNGVGGHNHNDQLSVNLKIKGDILINDPGSYIYTADPEQRNKYRSVHSHFTPTLNNEEPAELSGNLFRLEQNYEAGCLFFDGFHFLGYHTAYGEKIYRYIEVIKNKVIIVDSSEGGIPLDRLPLSDGKFLMPVKFSRGYGEQS